LPAPTVKFAPRIDLPTGGTKPASVALADFNGDGRIDIAVSNFDSDTIAVFLNNGNGTFAAPVLTAVQIPNGLGPIVAGDFNEDGKPDLIAATISGPQQDIVLLGKGDGTFTQSGSIPNSGGFNQGQAVDLNGDKHLDLVTEGGVALGMGDGTFGPVTYYAAGPPLGIYFGIAVGDFDGDGKLDIVTVDYFTATPPGGEVVFFRGNGDGTFQPPTWSPTPSTGPSSVSAADFNGDGKLDLVIGYSPGSADVVRGNGDGTFNLVGPQTSIYLSGLLGSGITVRAADLNQDGKTDVLVADYSVGVLAIALNNGGGTFLPSTQHTYMIAPGLNDIAVADLNGDGLPDVVVSNGTTNQISIFLSQK